MRKIRYRRLVTSPSTEAKERFTATRRAHWDFVHRSAARGLGGAYHRRLEQVYRIIVLPGLSVLELGCGEGDLLAALSPSRGVGVDFSPAGCAAARRRHPELTILEADASDLSSVDGPFDVVILSDLLNDVWDVQQILEQVRRISTPRTRIVVNGYSLLWELPLRAARSLGLTRPNLAQNWLTVGDIEGLLALAGFEIVRTWPEVLFPFPVPFLAPFANRFLVRLWPLRHLALTNFVLARPAAAPAAAEPLVSVVVPARNEAGNIAAILDRTPEMGRGTEIVFVEGHSTDGTWEAIERERALRPRRRTAAFRQEGMGKGDAVRLGFERAGGDVLMILDADLTVPPEDLPRFYEVLRSGKGEFVHGVRFVYPMEDRAMRPANLLGNKLFGLAFTWLLDQKVRDTLCGTKVLWKRDYARIAMARPLFGGLDPFGDFDLLFGAARCGLRIAEVPVRYRDRIYGTTNIRRWSHGALLLRMVLVAAFRLKFV
jgi:SAM-dependent methyltransferase